MSNSDFAENSRAVVGNNQAPEYARRVTEQMEHDYKALIDSITALLEKAREAPRTVASDEEAIALGSLVKEIRDAYQRADAYRTAEKEPYLRGEQSIDSFFFSWMEKCRRRNPRDRTLKPGAADVLQARIDAFLEEKRLAEEERRRLAAAETARVAREAQAKADREAREAEDARLAAERARKPENVAARTAEAAAAEETASAATVTAAIATEQAQAAHIATLASPAEMARTRGDGVLLTQAREPYAIVKDRTKLDAIALFPFFTDKEIEKALRGWAKVHSHNKQMDGAEIGYQRKGVTR